MSDNLSTAAGRTACLGLLEKGIPLVNGLFDLRIPLPQLRNWSSDVLAAPECAEGDAAYLQLAGAIFDVRVNSEGSLQQLTSAYPGIFLHARRTSPLAACYGHVQEMMDASDTQLMAGVRSIMQLRAPGVAEVFDPEGFVFVKINHFHWEYVTYVAMRSAGREYHRTIDTADYSGAVDTIVIIAMEKQRLRLQAAGAAPGCFDHHGFSLGISFNSGDLINDFDMAELPPIPRGAMIGCQGFFRGLFPAPSYKFSDGAFPKLLFWDAKLDEFFERAKQSADIIVFVGPDHLRGIKVRNWSGVVENIVIPATKVHELWPAVLAVVLGRLAEVFSAHKRVCVMMQAGLMSVPLGIGVGLMRPLFPNTCIHSFDLGQALDLAAYPSDTAGLWVQRPDTWEALEQGGQLPIYVDE